ncbi:GNAT family N-acetyltransferase [Spelaeicoccus albus]|uniref:GNAT superfamily N-acetyltransferase n=1 Tax=Spelaeicoccus albus TaxID=1280376 RepID=A0A7Z0D5C6_9MICO|nr:GNAT family N-acetyltransferase [Spelaeicoccus albus]NYI69175.1 GNAT superfamily N-acetyltransferase [Spelaeicoccus albus]
MLRDGVTVEIASDLDQVQVLGLYRAVGWIAYTEQPDVLQAALAGSSRIVVAREGGALIGLARVISDGASIAYLQDVLVHPRHQRRGLGAALVRSALEPYAEVRQKVLLTDDQPAQQAFYEHLGYQEISKTASGSLRAFVRFDR